jgi:hypothetical protein
VNRALLVFVRSNIEQFFSKKNRFSFQNLPFWYNDRICQIKSLEPSKYFTRCSSNHTGTSLFVLSLYALEKCKRTFLHYYDSLLGYDLITLSIIYNSLKKKFFFSFIKSNKDELKNNTEKKHFKV